ncbi:hypothetical protein [Tsuneonella sp. HG222]
MTTMSWVSIIALTGWLVLALSAYRSHRLSGKTMMVQGFIWASIFLLVAVVFAAVARG